MHMVRCVLFIQSRHGLEGQVWLTNWLTTARISDIYSSPLEEFVMLLQLLLHDMVLSRADLSKHSRCCAKQDLTHAL